MVNGHNKTCGVAGCTTLPSFALPGDEASRCAAHAGAGMVDVKSKRCKGAGCRKRPSFGKPGGQPEYCASHAGPEHINLVEAARKAKAAKG